MIEHNVWLLSPEEIVDLTGYKRANEQANALSKMGYTFDRRMNGTVIVLRTHIEMMLGYTSKSSEKIYKPNFDGLRENND